MRPACSCLHVLYWLRAEGTPRLALELLREEQRQTGQQGQVALLCRDSLELEPVFRDQGVVVHDMPGKGKQYGRLFVNAVRVLRRVRPGGVICYALGAHVFVAAAARLLGIPCVVHVGNAPSDEALARRKLRLQLQVGRPFVRRYLACSRFVRDECVRTYRLSPASVAAVPNGIDLRRFLAARERRHEPWRPGTRPLIVGMVASMEVHKDQDTLLRALADMRQRGMAARLRLVGSGSRAEMLRQLARELGVDEMVDWVGTVDNVLAELEQMDVFAYSVHDQEGLGIALVEALAAGLPVVGADVRACREVLEDGKLGRLIPDRDPAAWADALPAAALQGPVPEAALAPYGIAHTWQAYQAALRGTLP